MQPGIMDQRARDTGDFGHQRQLQILAACCAPDANFGRSPSSRTRLALPDIPEQYMRALQDERM